MEGLFKFTSLVIVLSATAFTVSSAVALPKNTSCAKYGFSCIDCNTVQLCTAEGKAVGKTFKCSGNLHCNPYSSRFCSPWVCDVEVTNMGSNSSERESSILIGHPNATATFACKTSGRSPDPNDGTKYIECSIDMLNGGFLKRVGSCPGDSLYVQILDSCVLTLANPTRFLHSSSESARGGSTSPAESSIGSFAGRRGSSLARVASGRAFNCTAAGRFPEATSCQIYHMCQDVGDGTFYGPFTYSCPAGSHFNPLFALCLPIKLAGCTVSG